MRKGVIAYAAFVTFLTLLPYLVGAGRAGDEWLFNGFTFGVDDGNAYLGKMRLGAEGEWKFSLFYTTEPHEGAFGLYVPYIALGQLVRLTDPTPTQLVPRLIFVFHLWRSLACFGLILAIERFIGYFLKHSAHRWLALVLGTLAGGLGWLLVLAGQDNFLGSLPVEYYIPEGFSFLVLYGLPHIATARMALLLGFLAIFKQKWFLAGMCWNIVGVMVTFYLPLIYVLLGVWGMVLWVKHRRLPWQLIKAGGLTLPLFSYNVWLFSSHAAFGQWSGQNQLPSPHPVQYVIGYGVLAVLALRGAGWAWRKKEDAFALLPSWILCVPVLVYLPLNVQRRLAEAVLIPLSILAVAGLVLIFRQHQKWAVRVLLFLLLPSTLLLWLGSLLTLFNPGCSEGACLYRPAAERAALHWLEDYAPSGAGVMGTSRTGNYVPIETDLRPFLSYGVETLDNQRKLALMQQFYRGELADPHALLDTYHIRYVWFGRLERELYADPTVWNKGLRLIYNQAEYQIYEVLE